MADDQEPEFPQALLTSLDEKLNRIPWIVSVLPKGELELLLEAAIELSKKGLDTKSEDCQRFFREGLTISFKYVLTYTQSTRNDATQNVILHNAKKLIELIVVKLPHDCLPLLELLAMVLNPNCKFHQHIESRPSESALSGSQPADDELFARPPDAQSPKGWLVDLVNHFGQLKGFHSLLNRFTSGAELSVPVIAALIKPFELCADFLIPQTIQKYFMPLVDIVPTFMDSLSDDEIKKQSNSETDTDSLSIIITSLDKLVARVPGQEDTTNKLMIFRLTMIPRFQRIQSMDVIRSEWKEAEVSLTQAARCATQQMIDEIRSIKSQYEEKLVRISEHITEHIASNETALAEKQSRFDKDIEKFTTDFEFFKCQKEELAKQIERMEQQNRISETKVCLDVGGHRFVTSTLTLAKYPDSMLGVMFSGRHPIIRESDESIFIDRDGSHFGHILNFLRDGDKMASSLPNNQQSLHSIKQEAEYYQITDLVNISEMKLKELERR